MALRSSVLVTELCIEGSNPMFTVLVCLVLVKMIVKRYTGYSIVNTVLPDKFCKFGLAYVGLVEPFFDIMVSRILTVTK